MFTTRPARWCPLCEAPLDGRCQLDRREPPPPPGPSGKAYVWGEGDPGWNPAFPVGLLTGRGVPVRDFTMDSVVADVPVRDFTMDSVVADVPVRDFTMDSVVADVPVRDFTMDSVVADVPVRDFTMDSVVAVISQGLHHGQCSG